MFCCDQSCVHTPTPTPALDGMGRRIFSVSSGSQFVLVVEALPGLSLANPAKSLTPIPPSGRSDLQIESNRNLGDNPTTTVCDKGPVSQGGAGIPAINPPSFDENNQVISDALNDFACRFNVFTASAPCTKVDPTQDPMLLTPGAPISTIQYCDLVTPVAAFPPGDSIVTVRARDEKGNTGPSKQIVIRVPPKP